MADYKKLMVWQKSRVLVGQVYRLTGRFPQSEMFGLTNQMRRAAVSVLSNIAEGYGRQLDTEFLHFLRITKGSLYELESQLYIAQDLGYMMEKEAVSALALCDEISRMITRLMQLLAARGTK